jgi:hypothetical protein
LNCHFFFNFLNMKISLQLNIHLHFQHFYQNWRLLITLLMLMNVNMFNLQWFFVKCSNSYFVDAKCTSCRFAHKSHSTYAFSNILQLFSMLVLYVNILMSFTKSIIVFCVVFFLKIREYSRCKINKKWAKLKNLVKCRRWYNA